MFRREASCAWQDAPMANRLRALLAEGGTAFGAWLLMASPAGAEMLGGLGFDYVCIDCQHGLLGVEDMRDIMLVLKGLATTPIVRVPANDASWIGKALDVGAEGVIVPLVNSKADAQRAAAACRFPPLGERSFGLARGHLPLGRNPDEINREVMCFPMIETREGLDAADAICTTPGIDGVYIGPSDLALSLGVPPLLPEPPAVHAEAVAAVRESCVAAGIVPAIHAHSGVDARARAAEGFRMVTCASDAAILAIGGLNELRAARGD
jgi:4-hydroxy-2-oxoheptanedioate aldolase